MKLTLPSLKKMNNQGISHFLVPLVIVMILAVGGVYAMVSSSAQSGDKNKSSKPKPGYMLVYSEQGRLNKVHILLQSSGDYKGTASNCGGNVKTGVVKKLNAKKPVKIKCDAIGGDASYYVGFYQDATYVSQTSVDIDSGYCTLVHPNGSQRKVQLVGGKCKDQDADNVTPVNVAVRVLPQLSKDQSSYTGYVEVSTPGRSVTKAQCVGQVDLGISLASDPYHVSLSFLPLKYTKPKGGGNAYCAAKIKKQKPAPGTYKVEATVKQGKYFNTASASANVTTTGSSN